MSERPAPPRVFVSYSDDSTAHAKRVLELAQWLRSHGVDAQIDQFEESPEEGWPRWVYRQIREAEFVLVIATPGYLRRCEDEQPRANITDSAAKFGSHLSLQELHEAGGRNRKFIPVLFDDDAIVESVPLPLRGATCYRLPDQRDDLYRRLTGQPKVQRVPLGVLKTFDDESLFDSVDELPARGRASFDEARAEDSLQAVLDAGLLDDAHDTHDRGPRRRFRRSWLRSNRNWVISVLAFGGAFMLVGLMLSPRLRGPGNDPTCKIQLTNSDDEVVDGIERVIFELPSGDRMTVVVEDGRTLEFACLPTDVQVQAHVYLRPGAGIDAQEGPLQASARIDGRLLLPASTSTIDGEVEKQRLMRVPRARPIPPRRVDDETPDRVDASGEGGPDVEPAPELEVGGAKPGAPSKPAKPKPKVTPLSEDPQLAAKLAVNEAELRRCYERALLEDSSLRGRIFADVRIDSAGKVRGFELVKDELSGSNRSLATCIGDEIESWKLGEPDQPRGTTTRISIEFAPIQ